MGSNMCPETILYCGSFNPIHRGHLAIAEAVVRLRGAAALWFVVSPQNPFKDESSLASEDDRMAMVRLAVCTLDPTLAIEACDVELTLPKPTRTIHTINSLQQSYPDRRFSLLMGGDNVASFDQWYRAEEILDRCTVLIYPRPGCPLPDSTIMRRMTLLSDVPLLEYEATTIREAIASGRSPQEALLPEVWQYIRAHRLYGCTDALAL